MSGNFRSLTLHYNQISFLENPSRYCQYPMRSGKPCPAFGKNYSCPPFAPKPNEIKAIIKKFSDFEVITYEFNLKEHIKKIKKAHPDWQEEKVFNSRLYNSHIYYALRKKLDEISQNEDCLILGNGSCWLCRSHGGCAAKNNLPCRYPNRKIKNSMEAVGINVFKTLYNIGYKLEKNPKNIVCQVGLICR